MSAPILESPSAPGFAPDPGSVSFDGPNSSPDGVADEVALGSGHQPNANLRPDGLWHPPKTVQVGGQALVEGVMMRSPRYVAASVRRKDGSITTRIEPATSFARTHPWARLAFIRGVVGLFEMMALGTRYLRWAGDVALADETAATSEADAASAPSNHSVAGPDNASVADANDGSTPAPDGAVKAVEKMPAWAFVLTTLGSLGIGILLFVALPHWIAGVTLGRVILPTAQPHTARGAEHLVAGRVGFNLFEGAVKLAIFITYVWFIGRGKNIRRVFEYHGAEHKVVYAVENNRPLTPAGARPFDTPHPRCGTGFAMLTILVSVLCFSFLPVPGSDWGARLLGAGWRILLMPVVAGVSYEIIKLTTHPRWQKLAVLVLTPGMWLQRLTTRQPDDAQLEVACQAMRAVLEAEGADSHPVAKPGLV